MTAPTERDLLDLLHLRYSAITPGNGPRWVVAEHVRSHCGFDARRTADLIAQDCWTSAGLQVHGHEVKVSRGDWLRELKDPSKANEFRPYCDRWWLVVPDPAIVHAGELPPGWGLLTATVRRDRLRVVVQAPKMQVLPMPRTMSVSLLRAAAKTARRPGRAAELVG